VANQNIPKQAEKISADCPHCGFSQLESAYAKSTFCRKCGQHFNIEKLLMKEASSLKAPSLLDRLSKLIMRDKIVDVTCFGCRTKQQVSTEVQSTSCTACGSYMDLREFKIAGPFGRSIQTHGNLIVTSKGDVASSRISCGSALIEGKVKGSLLCTGVIRVKCKGRFLGSVETEGLTIEKRSEVEFIRPVKARTVEVGGKITARIMCDGRVTISKGGHLDGVVHAKSIAVEKGGVFTGDLFISPTPAQTEDEFFAAEQSSSAGASPVDESEADEPEVDGSKDQEESSDESAPE